MSKKYAAWIGRGLALVTVLAGCAGRHPPSPAGYPDSVTSAQMAKAIQAVNNNPQMTPQQKTETINMLQSHLKVQSPAGSAPGSNP